MDKCPDCGAEYERVGAHLSKSDCSYPELSSHQFDVLTGILLGDGDVERRDTKRPKFRVRSTERDFLEHVYSVMEPHSCSITLGSTSEYASEKYGGDVENYSDSYQFRTISSPVFQPFAKWYENSTKVVPESVKFNKTVLRYWYVCDGSISGKSMRIYTSNMTDYLDRIVDSIDLFDFRLSVFDRSNGDRESYIYLTADETEEFLSETCPVPGYGYKWPDRKI